MRIYLATLAIIASALWLWIGVNVASSAVGSSNVGDGGSSLPACTSGLVGSVFYSAGHYWRCVSGPYRMVIVG